MASAERTLEQIQAEANDLILAARAGFRAGVAEMLRRMQQLADQFEPAIGEVSGGEAARAWRHVVVMDILAWHEETRLCLFCGRGAREDKLTCGDEACREASARQLIERRE